MRTLFVTGTDTGVGKTHVAAMLLRELVQAGHRIGAYKPACSGAIVTTDNPPSWDDITRIADALRGSRCATGSASVFPADAHGDHFDERALAEPVAHTMNLAEMICPQRFLAPLAPPLAARREGRRVDVAAINAGLAAWRNRCEALIVEGAGGWFCPLTETESFAQWVTRWRMPVLIVARRGLGTINHTLLTIAAIRTCRLPIMGVIMNQATEQDDDPSAEENGAEIEARSGVPVLGEILWKRTELQRGGRSVRMNWWTLMSELEGDDATLPVQTP